MAFGASDVGATTMIAWLKQYFLIVDWEAAYYALLDASETDGKHQLETIRALRDPETTDPVRWCIVHKSELHADNWPPPEVCQEAYYLGRNNCVIRDGVVTLDVVSDTATLD